MSARTTYAHPREQPRDLGDVRARLASHREQAAERVDMGGVDVERRHEHALRVHRPPQRDGVAVRQPQERGELRPRVARPRGELLEGDNRFGPRPLRLELARERLARPIVAGDDFEDPAERVDGEDVIDGSVAATRASSRPRRTTASGARARSNAERSDERRRSRAAPSPRTPTSKLMASGSSGSASRARSSRSADRASRSSRDPSPGSAAVRMRPAA